MHDPKSLSRPAWWLGCLLVLVAVQYGWNAYDVLALSGFDAGAHAGYVLTIVREGRLPHPLEGSQTFHPPAYYLAASGIWRLTEPAGPEVLNPALRALGALAWLGAGLVAHRLVRSLGAGAATAAVATALVWLVPCNQMSAVMFGNEAFGAALAAFALPFVLRLQRDPGDLRAAAGAGLMAGLAMATKFSGVWIAAACAVPFLGSLGAGTPLPMTRELEPMKSAEAALELRPRRVSDYLWVDPGSLRRPSIYQVPDRPGAFYQRNQAMTNVWGLLYAASWYDPFAHRVPVSQHADGVPWGPLLLLLGAVPTLLLGLGFALSTRELVRTRARTSTAPLTVMAWLALMAFVGFTWRVPTLGAAKASYLMPLAVPAAVFFARGAQALGARARGAALGISAAAAFVAALVFTSGLVFEPDRRADQTLVRTWLHYGEKLPGAHIDEAVRVLYGLPAEASSSR
ncbi:MAG: hypothetical protein JRH10_18425 [Deltaproteobacteria bacterium]|nr:hypothetical protein [Deltaproteobacteria bacterium]